MTRESFTDWEPKHPATVALLRHAMTIAEDYALQGYALTVRQLYYQLVAKDLVPNEQRSYKSLANIVTKARMAGYIDWESIVDRGRMSMMPSHWSSPESILRSAAKSYRRDRWERQLGYVEIWCEKDALSSVLEPVADDLVRDEIEGILDRDLYNETLDRERMEREWILNIARSNNDEQ